MKRPTSSSGFCVADSPIRRGDRVDLVDDHRLDVREDLARAAGEHEVQRLRRRDEDVGRLAAHRGAVALRRVAGAHADGQVGADAAQRRAQVAVDVVGERLQRRYVDQARVAVGVRLARETVKRPQKRRQRLARSSRRGDQCVLARRDRRPGLLLNRRRPVERRREPVAHAGRELLEDHVSQASPLHGQSVS
jgi:hypothetical protein